MATKVGSIYVEIKGDDTQWKKDMSSLRSAAVKSGKEVSEALNSGISANKASGGIKTISTSLTQLAQTAKIPEKQFKQTTIAIEKSFGDVADAIGMTRKEFASLNEKMLRNKAFQTATADLKSLTHAAGLSVSETKKLATQMGYSATEATKMANKIHNVKEASSGTISVFSNLAVAAAAAFSIREISRFAVELKNVGVTLDSLKFAYEAVTGSQSLAGKEMQFVNDTAKGLGLGLSALEEGYKGILAASQGTNLAGEETRRIFTAISKAAAVYGMTADQTKLSLKAISDMMSKGTVAAEELKGQLGDHLYGALNIAAAGMGYTTEKLMDLMKKGDILADELIPKLSDELENRLAVAAEKAGDTSRAAFENFNTAVLELKRTIAESGILEYMAKVARNATGMINDVRSAIDSVNHEKAKASVEEYNAAILKATKDAEEFKAMWGNTRSVIPESLKKEFDSLTNRIEVLKAARDKLEVNNFNASAFDDFYVVPVTAAEKAAKKLEKTLQEEYSKTTEYRLIEAKKQLADYMTVEGRKPEYVAMMQAEIASLEKTANASSIAEQKKVASEYKKTIAEQKKAVDDFNSDYEKATDSNFDLEIERVEQHYDERMKLVRKGLVDEQKVQDLYVIEWFDVYDKDMANYEKAQEHKKKIANETLKEEKKIAKEKLDTTIKMLDGMDVKDEQYYSLELQRISELAKKYEQLSGDAVLATKWRAQEEEKINKQKTLQYGTFFEGLKIGFEDSIKDLDTWAEHGETVAKNMSENMSSALSDTFFDALKGDIDDIEQVWKSFMDSMLHSLTDTVADMAVQWGIGAVGTATGWWDTGAWEIKRDHVAMVHKGEMIVPADVASVIRYGAGSSSVSDLAKVSPSGGHEWSKSDKSLLTQMMSTPSSQNKQDVAEMSALDKKSNKAFTAGTVRSLMGSLAQGMSLYSRDAISVKDLATGMIGPNLGAAAITGGLSAYTNSQLGLDTSKFGKIGSVAGSIGGGLIGNVVGSLIGNTAGGVVGMSLGDMFNARDGEDTRDALEEIYGFIEGMQAYAAISAESEAYVKSFIGNATWGNDSGRVSKSSYGSGGYSGSSTGGTVSIGGGFTTDSSGNRVSVPGLSSSSGGSSRGGTGGSPGNAGHSNARGYYSGGVIDELMVPYGEDGWAAVQFGEGVVSKTGMDMLEKLNSGNLESYPTYDEDSNLADTINITNNISSDVLSAIGEDIPTELTLKDAGIVLDDMSKAVELFNIIISDGIATDELKSAYQSFVGVGLSASDAATATNLLIEEYKSQVLVSEEAAEATKAHLQSVSDFNESVQDTIDDDTLSDYEKSLKSLNEWYSEQVDIAKELGIEIDSLNKAYGLQKELIYDDILAEKRSLQIDILEALGNTEEAVAMQREDTINDLIAEYGDEADSIINLQKALWELNDASEDLATAQSAYKEGLQEELDILENNLSTAKSTYLDLLESELDILENNLSTAKSNYIDLLNDELSVHEDLVSSLESAIESIKEYRDELETGTSSPVSKQEDLLVKRTILAAQAMTGDTDSISELLSVSSDYLEVVQGMSKTSLEYEREVAITKAILANVETSADKQLTVEKNQVAQFENLIDDVNGTTAVITDMDVARTAYEEAKSALDNNWYADEIESLSGTTTAITDMDVARTAYEEAKSALDNNWYATEIESLNDIKLSLSDLKASYDNAQAAWTKAVSNSTSSGDGGYLYTSPDPSESWSTGVVGSDIISGPFTTSTGSAYLQANPDVLAAYESSGLPQGPYYARDFANQHYVQYGQYENRDLGFADGGILSGPTSGYQVDATFHGPEAIVPLDRLDHSEIVRAISVLRDENKAHFISLIKTVLKISRHTQIVEKWDASGKVPVEVIS